MAKDSIDAVTHDLTRAAAHLARCAKSLRVCAAHADKGDDYAVEGLEPAHQRVAAARIRLDAAWAAYERALAVPR